MISIFTAITASIWPTSCGIVHLWRVL
jgi:hypothetical protein